MIHRMSFDDFKRNFTNIEICNITLDQFDVDQSSKLHIYIDSIKSHAVVMLTIMGPCSYKAYQEVDIKHH